MSNCDIMTYNRHNDIQCNTSLTKITNKQTNTFIQT